MSPLRVLGVGLLAGAVGAAMQDVFFRLTRRITPPPVKDAFAPPVPEQKEETALETTARRLVEGMAARGPLTKSQKARIGALLHYGFGARWGALYGLKRESFPWLASPAGVAAFSAGVWMVSDNLLLPLFRLAAWPQHYPARNHVYALVAHLAYGAATAAAYETLRGATRPRATARQRVASQSNAHPARLL